MISFNLLATSFQNISLQNFTVLPVEHSTFLLNTFTNGLSSVPTKIRWNLALKGRVVCNLWDGELHVWDKMCSNNSVMWKNDVIRNFFWSQQIFTLDDYWWRSTILFLEKQQCNIPSISFHYSQLSNKSTAGNKSTTTPKFLFQAIVPLK